MDRPAFVLVRADVGPCAGIMVCVAANQTVVIAVMGRVAKCRANASVSDEGISLGLN